MKKFAPIGFVLLAFAALFMASTNQAEDKTTNYPDRPIKMFIGFAAGGSSDLSGRALASELKNVLGQPVPVINQPGAGSMIAARKVAKSRPDGYTIWFGSLGTLLLQSELEHTSLDFFDDFELIGLTGQVVPAIGVPTSSPYYSVQDIIDAARARPGELRWAHNGMGAAFAAMGMSFVAENELDVVGVPFQGAKGVRLAIYANQVDFGVVSEGERLMFGEEKVRVLASLRSSKDGAVDADLPTISELGIPFVEIASPVGVMVPKGTPAKVVDKLREAVSEAAASEDFKDRMSNLYIASINLDSDEGASLAAEIVSRVQRLLPALKSKSHADSFATGSSFAPLMVGGLLISLLIVNAVNSFGSANSGAAPVRASANGENTASETSLCYLQMIVKAALLMLIMVFYGFSHGWFGYLITTALTGYIVFLFAGNRFNASLVHGSAGAIVLYFVFVLVLNIYDPPGTVLDVSSVFRR